MKINEIFESIQGEGKYVGHPALFIRVSGCTRDCEWCDTKYHKEGKEMSVKEVVKRIKKYEGNIIVWTGGEPMLYDDEIYNIISDVDIETYEHHLESNGDILPQYSNFKYLCWSPKKIRVIKNVKAFVYQLMINSNIDWDIKIVTDLELNKELIPYATMLMPLTTYDKEKDKEIKKKVWDYCVKNKIKYSPRLQVDVWGKKRGV